MEDGRGSSGIGSGKSIGLAEGILLPAEAVESNRSRPRAMVKNRVNVGVKIGVIIMVMDMCKIRGIATG